MVEACLTDRAGTQFPDECPRDASNTRQAVEPVVKTHLADLLMDFCAQGLHASEHFSIPRIAGVAHETIERGLRHDLRVDVLDMLLDLPFDQCGVLPIVDPAAPREGQDINELAENVDLPLAGSRIADPYRR